MRNKKIIIGIVLLIIAVVLMIVLFKDISKNNNSNISKDAIKFKKEYEKLNGKEVGSGFTYFDLNIKEDNAFVYKSAEEIIEIIESKTGLIYLGYSNCPWCRNAVNVLQHVNAGKIYYLDMTNHRDTYEVINNVITKTKDGTKEYYRQMELLDETLMDYELSDGIKVGEKRIYVPMVIGVKDGEIVGYHIDVVDLDEGQNPFDSLTNKQQSKLKLIYDEINAKVNDDMCTFDDNHGC